MNIGSALMLLFMLTNNGKTNKETGKQSAVVDIHSQEKEVVAYIASLEGHIDDAFSRVANTEAILDECISLTKHQKEITDFLETYPLNTAMSGIDTCLRTSPCDKNIYARSVHLKKCFAFILIDAIKSLQGELNTRELYRTFLDMGLCAAKTYIRTMESIDWNAMALAIEDTETFLRTSDGNEAIGGLIDMMSECGLGCIAMPLDYLGDLVNLFVGNNMEFIFQMVEDMNPYCHIF